MYRFIGTNDKIMSNEEVLKALKKIEGYNPSVSITKNIINGDVTFTCNITEGKVVVTANGGTPRFAAINAVNNFVDSVRAGNKKSREKGINADRKSRQKEKAKVADELEGLDI